IPTPFSTFVGSVKTVGSTVAGRHAATKAVTLVVGKQYTFSVAYKPILGFDKVSFFLDHGSAAGRYGNAFNFTYSTMTTNNANLSFLKMTDGYVRLSITSTATVIAPTITLAGVGSSVNDYVPLAITDNFITCAVQVEELPFATSYIPTTTLAVTRASDSLTFVKEGNMPKVNSPMTLVADVEMSGLVASAAVMYVAKLGNAASNLYDLRAKAYGLGATAVQAKYGAGAQLFPNGTSPVGFVSRLSMGVSSNGNYGAIDGEIHFAGNNTVVDAPLGAIEIGANLYGRIRNFRIYDQALTDQEIGAL
ncbi:MAG: hypothetical protein R8M45_04715, partial [Ghiorsea sp.]